MDSILSFEEYINKYGKTKNDFAELSEPLQRAWYDEYRIWCDEENRKREYDRYISNMTEKEVYFEMLRNWGFPFLPTGDPLIGDD